MSTEKVTEKVKDIKLVETITTSNDSTTLNVVPNEPNGASEGQAIQTASTKETITTKPDVDYRPSKPTPQVLAAKDQLAAGLVRYPLSRLSLPKPSTFRPTSLNYFTVVHYMDLLMSNNIYFQREGYPWHPFVTRLYASFLFVYQTLRAMDQAKTLSLTQRVILRSLEHDLPPEKLPVPEPLAPMLKSIACCEPDNSLYSTVSPYIPEEVGPAAADDLRPRHDTDLFLPNMITLSAFAHKIIDANDDNIPDFTLPGTFDNTADRELVGNVFTAGHWTENQRATLLQPCLIYAPETTREIDETFHLNGGSLDLPAFGPNEHTTHFADFFALTDVSWVDRLIKMMSSYSSYFKNSTNLGGCAPYGPTACLVRSRPFQLTSANAATNVIHTLTHAFPNKGCYVYLYDHRTYEHNIPQVYSMMGRYSCINTLSNYQGLGPYSRINSGHNHGRAGPYWDQNPSILRLATDAAFQTVEDHISTAIYVEQPKL